MAAHTSQFGAGTHIQDYPGCPAEGQILQRGQVWNMPVFSLMTHSTINTPQLSRSARVYGRVYWMLALVPRRTLSRPSWSSSRLELEALQSDTCTVQWRPAATHTQMEADTHSSTEEPMRRQEKSDSSAIFIFTWEKSFVSLSFFTSSPNKVFFFFLTLKIQRCEARKVMQAVIIFFHMVWRTVELLSMLPGSRQAAVRPQLSGQQYSDWRCILKTTL